MNTWDSGLIAPATREVVLGIVFDDRIFDWLARRMCNLAGTELPEFFLGNFSCPLYHQRAL